MVSPPVHMSVCPSPALELGWFGHTSVAPPTAPACWALLGSLLRRSVALASGRTLSLCCFSPGFSSFGVCSDLGWLAAVLPGFLPPFGGTLLPLSWILLGGSCSLVVQAPGVFLESLLGFFPPASSVC